MTLQQIRDMLATFGVQNDNLAVFLDAKIRDARTEAIRVALATQTTLSANQMETRTNNLVDLLDQKQTKSQG